MSTLSRCETGRACGGLPGTYHFPAARDLGAERFGHRQIHLLVDGEPVGAKAALGKAREEAGLVDGARERLAGLDEAVGQADRAGPRRPRRVGP